MNGALRAHVDDALTRREHAGEGAITCGSGHERVLAHANRGALRGRTGATTL
jgi:hypothetical protein